MVLDGSSWCLVIDQAIIVIHEVDKLTTVAAVNQASQRRYGGGSGGDLAGPRGEAR